MPHRVVASVAGYSDTSLSETHRESHGGEVAGKTGVLHALKKIVVLHLAAFEKAMNLAVRTGCRIGGMRFRNRAPDILVMQRPFRHAEGLVLDPPLLVVEILSPDDRMQETLRRLREYENIRVPHIVQMDPDDRSTYVFVGGNLVRRELADLDLPGGIRIPFETRDLLAKLDEEN